MHGRMTQCMRKGAQQVSVNEAGSEYVLVSERGIGPIAQLLAVVWCK
jgi:hypothetical protein